MQERGTCVFFGSVSSTYCSYYGYYLRVRRLVNSLSRVQLTVAGFEVLQSSDCLRDWGLQFTKPHKQSDRAWLFVLLCGERRPLHGTETLFSCGESEADSCAVAFEIDIMRGREESVLSRELPRGRSQTRRESLTRGTREKLPN